MIFMVLYSRYRSMALTTIIMGNIPLALIGSVIALWISGQPLSVAALVGIITLTGIATRNGILKISHYINLCAFEGETFGQHDIVRGSLGTPYAGADDRAGGRLRTDAAAALRRRPRARSLHPWQSSSSAAW